mgnify:CR=1 FL=1
MEAPVVDDARLVDQVRACREAVTASREVLGEEHPETLASVKNLISLLEATGRPEDAEPLREWLRRAESREGE